MTRPDRMAAGACDHVVGSHGSEPITETEWSEFVALFGRAVEFFNGTKFAVPHPGFLSAHPYCCGCGAAVDGERFGASIGAALAEPSGPGFTRDTYTEWVYSKGLSK